MKKGLVTVFATASVVIGGGYAALQTSYVQDRVIAHVQDNLAAKAGRNVDIKTLKQPTNAWTTEKFDVQKFKITRDKDGTLGFWALGKEKATGRPVEAVCNIKACTVKRAPGP